MRRPPRDRRPRAASMQGHRPKVEARAGRKPAAAAEPDPTERRTAARRDLPRTQTARLPAPSPARMTPSHACLMLAGCPYDTTIKSAIRETYLGLPDTDPPTCVTIQRFYDYPCGNITAKVCK